MQYKLSATFEVPDEIADRLSEYSDETLIESFRAVCEYEPLPLGSATEFNVEVIR